MVKKSDSYFRLKRGSMTVETAAIMGIVIFVIFSVLYLCFYVHNRAWLTSAAYEAALTGSIEAINDDEKVYDVTWARGKDLADTGFFGAENLTMQVQTGKKIQVSYNLETVQEFGGIHWDLNVEGSSKVVDPVKRIRQLKAAADIFEAIGG